MPMENRDVKSRQLHGISNTIVACGPVDAARCACAVMTYPFEVIFSTKKLACGEVPFSAGDV